MITEIGQSNLGSKHTAIKMWEVSVESGRRELREHRHISFEFSLVTNGGGLYHTPQGQKEMRKGDIFVFTSNEPHCIIDVNPGGLKLLNLHFSSKLIESNSLLDESYPYIFYNHSKEFDCRISNNPRLFELLMKIKLELSEKRSGFACMLSGLISEIYAELIRNQCYYSRGDDLSSSVISRLEKGIDYINEHYCEEISLKSIAEKSSISPNYFSALFKECLNINLWDYVTSKRIEKSKRMLTKNRELTVLDIAIQCGFNNTANFNRAFKLYTGITPSCYRKNRFENII